jgi:hypothetical protein
MLRRTSEPLLRPLMLWRRSRKKVARLKDAQAVFLRYPKSGVTWLRVMVSHIYLARMGIADGPVVGSREFDDAVSGAPRVFVAGDSTSPKLIGEIAAAISRLPTVFLMRDPRDVTVSLFFHLSKRSTPLERAVFSVRDGFEQAGLFAFMMNPTYGLSRTIGFLNRWWPEVMSAPTGVIVRYEDMRVDPAGVLCRVMMLLGDEPTEDEIAKSVEFASFEAMKERERADSAGSKILRPGNREDDQSYKVRKGQVGAFAQHFTLEEAERIDALLDSSLDPRIGYRESLKEALDGGASRIEIA